MMQRSLIVLFSLIFLATACSAEPVEVTRVVESEVTRVVEVTQMVPATVIVERIAEITREVEVTRIVERVVTPAPPPTETPAPEPTAVDTNEKFGRNYVGVAEAGDLTIEVARVVFGNRDVLFGEQEEWPEEYGDAPVLGEIILKITNNGDRVLKLWPFYDGAVQVNGEQIRLEDLRVYAFGDELDEEILPGATVIGGLWFPVNRSAVSDINAFSYHTLHAPFDPETYDQYGNTVTIIVDLSEHIWEELPEELNFP